MDDKQQNFYKRLLINIRVKCLKQGIKKSEFCLKQGRKISDICLKQGQGMRGRAAPPHPGIYRVPPREHMKARENITIKYVKTTVPTHDLPRHNEYFALSLAVRIERHDDRNG